MEYKWKINFNIENVKLMEIWSKDCLYLVPNVGKDEFGGDVDEIAGYYRAKTEGDNQAEAEEEAKEIIEGLVASCSIVTGRERLQVGYIVPPHLENEKELKEKGLPVNRTVPPLTIVGYIDEGLMSSSLNDSYSFFKDLKKLPQTKKLILAMKWFTRAIAYDDPYDRFIAFWISFNAFYNLYYAASTNDSDSTKMEFLVRNLFDESEAYQLLNDQIEIVRQLSSQKGCYVSSSGGTNYARELETNLNAKNYQRALESAIRCLYSIRKTLFHGARDTGETEKRIVDNVNPLLKQIVRRSVLKYVSRLNMNTS